MPPADSQFALPALTMGPGTAYEILDVDGLGIQVAPNDLELISGGVYAARDRVPGRSVVFTVDVAGVPGSDFAGKLSAFLTAWQPSNADQALTFKRQGVANNRVLNGRPRQCRYKFDQPGEAGVQRFVTEFFCPDPNIYDAVTRAAVFY